MSQFETSDHVSTRSVLRHRPIGTTTTSMGRRSVVTTAATPAVQRASRPRHTNTSDDIASWSQADMILDEDERNTYLPVTQSGNRNAMVITNPGRSQVARIRTDEIHVREDTHSAPSYYAHPLLYLGLGMLGMLVLWTLSSAALGWFNTTLDDIRYGRPRTFQTDAWVGHNEQTHVQSHFLALNLSGHIEIIEFSGGDATHMHVYVGPQLYGSGNDLVAVTLQFVDVNGDQKPDMIINFQGSRTVFINDQGAFRPLQPAERQPVEQFILHMSH